MLYPAFSRKWTSLFNPALLTTAGCLAFLVLLSSCNNNGSVSSTNSDSPKHDSAAKTIVTADCLNVLYLENFANSGGVVHEQLKRLIGDWHGNSRQKKAMFNFFIDTNGQLRLVGYPATNHNEEVIVRDSVQLKVAYKTTNKWPAEAVTYFGSLQFVKSVRDSLQDHVFEQRPRPGHSSAGYQYIVFSPRIETSATDTAHKYIVYDISRQASVPEAGKKLQTRIGVANPSPPYGSY